MRSSRGSEGILPSPQFTHIFYFVCNDLIFFRKEDVTLSMLRLTVEGPRGSTRFETFYIKTFATTNFDFVITYLDKYITKL